MEVKLEISRVTMELGEDVSRDDISVTFPIPQDVEIIHSEYIIDVVDQIVSSCINSWGNKEDKGV